jgi:CBS domain-containing protein
MSEVLKMKGNMTGRLNQMLQSILTEKRTRHLPVMNNGKLIGAISTGYAVKSVIDDQRFTIEQLEGYVTGFS